MAKKKLRWMPLDNAAKIYPAARRPNWSNVFRLSATLSEEIDREVMQSALDVTVHRFPSIAVRLRRGVFWYYLQQLTEAPLIRDESSYPLVHMTKEETRKCALRVLIYRNRVAIELFHSLTDGNGALIFLKSLVAEYLEQKYGVKISAVHGVFDRSEEPTAEELEDSYQKYAAEIAAPRNEKSAWNPPGTPEVAGFLNLTCMQVNTKEVLAKAHEYRVSVTTFLCAAMIQALQDLQEDLVPNRKRRKPIKVLIPVNLRNLFESKSLRNFALYTIPEILPRIGRYEFEEICRAVQNHMGAEITQKQMGMKIAANVNSERFAIVKVMPLFIKNFVMKAVYDAVGERTSCMTLSNLGAIKLPEEMLPYVKRVDFVLGTQAITPCNCGVISLGDTMYINFVRNIRESQLEYRFFRVLQKLGLSVTVESNVRDE